MRIQEGIFINKINNKLIIFSGSSGVGKKTILTRLLSDDSLSLKYSVSATTRKPREGEIEGEDYFFISHELFDKLIKKNEFLEWATFVDNKYGTPKKFIKETLKNGLNPILEIEVQGALNVMKNYDGEYVSIFVVPPSMEELKRRLEIRNTEDSSQIEKRLNEAIKEIQLKHRYQYVVVNDDLDRCVNEIKEILKNEI